ncbi:MAG TPA: hypothetical protein VKA84_22915 [Gemmatimonadaceae bacterium]|nr:hypothetical protein [Gemmatimonadaceae bacterium]
MKCRAFVPLVLVACAALAGACKDSTASGAIVRTSTDTMVALAVTGTPLTSPSALSLVGYRADTADDLFADPSLLRVDSIFDFDLVFDIDAAGKTVLMTPQSVANRLAVRVIPTSLGPRGVGPHRVGLQVATAGTNFETIEESPNGGFVYDSLVRVDPGSAVFVQSYVTFCSGLVRPFLFAKLVVDSANAATRKVYFRVTLNRNCGYRSFRPGIPTV